MANLNVLPAFGNKGRIHVVVETPRGSTAKFKFDGELGTFKYVRALRGTLKYPFDWGFVPSTKGEDGDPLDAMVLHDDASFPGAVIACRAIGILEVEQTEKGKTFRNDRVIFLPADAAEDDPKAAVAKLQKQKRKLERFFRAAIAGTGKKLNYVGWKDDKAASAAVKKAAAKTRRRK